MAKKDVNGPAADRSPAEVIYDFALDAAGLPVREDGESFDIHRGRISKGPNTQLQLERLAEQANLLDRGRAVHAAQSARDYHSDPTPAEAHARTP